VGRRVDPTSLLHFLLKKTQREKKRDKTKVKKNGCIKDFFFLQSESRRLVLLKSIHLKNRERVMYLLSIYIFFVGKDWLACRHFQDPISSVLFLSLKRLARRERESCQRQRREFLGTNLFVKDFLFCSG